MPRFPIQFLLSLFIIAMNMQPAAFAHDSEAPGPFGEPLNISSLGRSALGIQVQSVERKMMPMEIKVPGSIQNIPTHQYDQHSPVSGVISSVDVNLGQLVKEGQPLCIIESPEMNQLAATLLQDRLDLESSLATQQTALDEEVRSAQDRFNLAQYNQARTQKLYDEKIASLKDLQQAQTDLAIATARVDAAKRNREIVMKTLQAKLELVLNPLRQRLRMLGVQEKDIKKMVSRQATDTTLPVFAARSGFVTSINASPGKSIDSSVSLFTISDQSKLWATAQIYEDDIARMRMGQEVEVKVQALHGEMVTGVLTYIGTEVDPQTRTLPVRAELPNPDFRLKPDMYAELYIHTSAPAPVVAIPRDATVQLRGRDAVFVDHNGSFQAQFVRLGRSVGDQVEVISGLKIGERIVTRGAFQLAAQMVKDSGGAELFSAASEGEHLEDHEHDATADAGMSMNWQTLMVVIGVAFILGFALCSLFFFRGNKVPVLPGDSALSDEEELQIKKTEAVDVPEAAPFVGTETNPPGRTTSRKGRES